ncbi:MAG: SHOCT domain-containing protein [Lachnospiraceae bacterium]|nr:SHOCT domain-containing protein [Lachnospiraceae bacterium]
MELTNSLLKIDRKGNEGEHSIPLSQIVSVFIKKPGLTSNGLIHIQTVASLGTPAAKAKIEYGMDMNTIFFTKSSYQEALNFKDAIENAISSQTWNSTPTTQSAPEKQSDLTSQLKELKCLVEQGLISEDDYEKKKQSLLGL